MSNQPQGCKFLGDAVLVHRGGNAVAALLQACRAVGHTDTDADHIGHLQVVVTVTKADAVLQGHAQIVTYRLDAAPFIKPMISSY